LFSWLPDGGALDYYQRAGDDYQFTVADLASDNTRVLGTPCGLTPAWRTNTQVLWNPCGEGLSLSELKDGTVHNTRLLDTEARNVTLTLNRNIAVVHPAVFDDGNTTMYVPDANWQAYDFATGRLQNLEGTGGTPCCGTLLQ
jgi:Tol biopolymer transport system component